MSWLKINLFSKCIFLQIKILSLAFPQLDKTKHHQILSKIYLHYFLAVVSIIIFITKLAVGIIQQTLIKILINILYIFIKNYSMAFIPLLWPHSMLMFSNVHFKIYFNNYTYTLTI